MQKQFHVKINPMKISTSHTNITPNTQFGPWVTPWVFNPWATAQPIPKMPAGQCVEPLSNGHKKISFNSPPTPNRTRNTINECYLGKRGHVIPLLSGLKPPSWEVQLSIHLEMTVAILKIWEFHSVEVSELFCHSEIT